MCLSSGARSSAPPGRPCIDSSRYVRISGACREVFLPQGSELKLYAPGQAPGDCGAECQRYTAADIPASGALTVPAIAGRLIPWKLLPRVAYLINLLEHPPIRVVSVALWHAQGRGWSWK